MKPADSALLIVDDNEDNRYTLTKRLQREGYQNVTSELFSEERLEEALRSLTAASASGMVTGVMERVRTFAASAVQADDIAAMGLRFVK